MPTYSDNKRTRQMQKDALKYILVSLGDYDDIETSGAKIIERGEGCYIYDTDGNRYLDTFASLLTTVCGHHRPEVHAAMLEQMQKIEFYPNYHDCFTPPMIELSKRLAKLAPGNLEVSFFVEGGSLATESALKMARQYYWEKGAKDRKKVLFRRWSYHGATLGASSATGIPWFREPQEPLVPGFVPVMSPHPYRCELDLSPKQSAEIALRNTEAVIKWEGPESIAAMILDPVPGSNVGFPVPPKDYLPRLCELLRKHGILIIFDEIQVGMGKTGKFLCCEHWDVVPDILCLAKSLGGGFVPIGVAMTTQEIADTFREPGHEFRHGFTYSGNPMSCAATLAVLDIYEKENLVENAAKRGRYLERKLKALYDYPIVGDIRGIGLLRAIELVADRETKEPFDADMGVGRFVRDFCYRHGMILRNNGDILVLAPALIITKEIIDEMVTLIDKAIVAAMKHFKL